MLRRSEFWDAIIFRVFRWAFFSLFLALLPILIGAFSALTRADEVFHFEGLFAHGELLLVTAAVVGAALAELVGPHDERFRNVRFISGASSATVVLAASVWFADIAAAIRDRTRIDVHSVAVGSFWLFGFAAICGIACIVVAETAALPPAQSDAGPR
jgi:hypothetical protein